MHFRMETKNRRDRKLPNPQDLGACNPTNDFESLCQRAVSCRACFDSMPLKPAMIDLAQPRWVGPGYWTSELRVCAVLVNPGSGKNQSSNVRLRDLLRGFRAGEIELEAILKFQRTDMPNWGNGRFVAYFRDELRLDIDKIAFANIAWCAERDNHYPSAMLVSCFGRHTDDLLKLLDPHVVLLCGEAVQDFSAPILKSLQNVRIIPAPHYAARYSSVRMQDELNAVRSALLACGVPSLDEVENLTFITGSSGRSDIASRPIYSAAERSAEIARQLGLPVHSKVASGRYLRCKTAIPKVHIVVFHRHGHDCVGVEGTGPSREPVLERHEDWHRIGLIAHQKSPDSHKTASTFIIERVPGSDGSLHPALYATYQELVDMLGKTEI